MSVIDTTDRDRVVSVAEDGTPVTGAMVDEWERAYASGALPDGYAPDGAARSGRPPLHGERMSTITVRLPRSMRDALDREAAARGVSTSSYVREVIALRETA